MIKRILTSTLAFALLAGAGVAQDSQSWQWSAPPEEEYAVLMPEQPVRVRRELPFSETRRLTPPVYEVSTEGVLYSVLSFEKSRQATAFKSLNDFVNGFRQALLNSSASGDSTLTFERDITVNGHAGQQFIIQARGAAGTARVFESFDHYYVVMTIGAKAGEPAADLFFNSFALKQRVRGDPSDEDLLGNLVRPEARPSGPQSPWQVAGGPAASDRPVVVGARRDIGPVGPKPSAAGTSPAKTGQKMIVSGGVVDGKAISKPQPEYPAIARQARAQGTVAVQVVVDEEGYVISASAISGHPLLQQAAVNAARQARFTPTLLDGEPVKVSGILSYNFTLK